MYIPYVKVRLLMSHFVISLETANKILKKDIYTHTLLIYKYADRIVSGDKRLVPALKFYYLFLNTCMSHAVKSA